MKTEPFIIITILTCLISAIAGYNVVRWYRANKKRIRLYLAFMRWYFRHDREIAEQLLEHFQDPDKNHSFSLEAYYNAGYQDALAYLPEMLPVERSHLDTLKNSGAKNGDKWILCIRGQSNRPGKKFIEEIKKLGFEIDSDRYDQFIDEWKIVVIKN